MFRLCLRSRSVLTRPSCALTRSETPGFRSGIRQNTHDSKQTDIFHSVPPSENRLLQTIMNSDSLAETKLCVAKAHEQGIPMSLKSYTAFLRKLAKFGDLATMEKVLDEMLLDPLLVPDQRVFSSTIYAFGIAGDWERAEKCFKLAVSLRIRPSLFMYSGILSAARKLKHPSLMSYFLRMVDTDNLLPAALRVMNRMVDLGLKPESKMVAVYLANMGSMNPSKVREFARSIWAAVQKSDATLDMFGCESFVLNCGGEVEVVDGVWHHVRQNAMKPTQLLFKKSILAYNNRTRAVTGLELLREMRASGFTPDQPLYTSSLAAQAAVNSEAGVTETFQMLNKDHGSSAAWDAPTKRSVIRALGRMGKFAEVDAFWLEWERSKVDLSDNRFLHAYLFPALEGGFFERAFQLRKQLIDKGYTLPRDVTLSFESCERHATAPQAPLVNAGTVNNS